MDLQSFRDHLAAELESRPDVRSPEIQSYALTTAALARRILRHLHIDDLTVPSELHSDRPTYKLTEILNCIIHFRVLHQDALSYPMPGMQEDIISLYSDRNRRYSERFYIRLPVYFELIGRLAHDDQLVAGYLLRRVVTLLSRAVKVDAEHDEYFLKELHGLIVSAWYLTAKLAKDHIIELSSEIFVDCYEEAVGASPEERARFFARWSCAEFVEGCGSAWWWAPFTPGKLQIAGTVTYCVFLHAIEPKEGGAIRGLAVSFSALIDMFKDIRRQLPKSSK